MEGLIYKATCKTTGLCYIGQTVFSLDKRKTAHLRKKNDGTKFHNALLTYGEDDFLWEIVETVEADKEGLEVLLNEREQYWVDYYDSYNNGYNSDKGGGMKNSLRYFNEHQMTKFKNPSDEARAKMSFATKGKPKSYKTKQLMKEHHADCCGDNNPMFGKSQSDSTKEKMRQARIAYWKNRRRSN